MKVLESKALRYITLDVHSDERGDLIPLEYTPNGLAFEPQRSFYLTNVPSNETRAGHAVDCDLFIICLKGNVKLEHKLSESENTIWNLDSIRKGILIPAYNYITLKEFSEEALVVIYASKKFRDTHYFSFDELQGR